MILDENLERQEEQNAVKGGGLVDGVEPKVTLTVGNSESRHQQPGKQERSRWTRDPHHFSVKDS